MILHLQPGIYSLNVTVYDPFGNGISAIFTVAVSPPEQDTTDPVWIVPPIDESLEYGEPFIQRLGAWDSSGIVDWWLNDTTLFAIDENGIIRNITDLEPGVYSLEVRAYDLYDNYCSAIFVVTVHEAPITTTTTTSTVTYISTLTTITTTTVTTETTSTMETEPTTSTTSPTTPVPPNGMDPLVALVLGVGLGGGLVVIVVIILLYKRRLSPS